MSLHYLAKLLLRTCDHVRYLTSHCLRMCPSMGKWSWYSLTLEWRLMAHTAVTYSWHSSYRLSCMRSLANSLCSSKTVTCAHRACETISQPSGMADIHFHFIRPVGTKNPHLKLVHHHKIWGEMQQWLQLMKVHDPDGTEAVYAISGA